MSRSRDDGCGRLVKAALARGAKDNVTVVLARVGRTIAATNPVRI